MPIETFSGTHEWHETVLNDTDAVENGNAEQIIDDINSGRCPRCWGPLPELPEFPAGSRITACRSIPICGRCGSDEAFEANYDGGMSPASEWPLAVEDIDERRARFEQHGKLAFLTADGHLITEDGATPVVIPGNTGGWAQFGTAQEG